MRRGLAGGRCPSICFWKRELLRVRMFSLGILMRFFSGAGEQVSRRARS